MTPLREAAMTDAQYEAHRAALRADLGFPEDYVPGWRLSPADAREIGPREVPVELPAGRGRLGLR